MAELNKSAQKTEEVPCTICQSRFPKHGGRLIWRRWSTYFPGRRSSWTNVSQLDFSCGPCYGKHMREWGEEGLKVGPVNWEDEFYAYEVQLRDAGGYKFYLPSKSQWYILGEKVYIPEEVRMLAPTR